MISMIGQEFPPPWFLELFMQKLYHGVFFYLQTRIKPKIQKALIPLALSVLAKIDIFGF